VVFIRCAKNQGKNKNEIKKIQTKEKKLKQNKKKVK